MKTITFLFLYYTLLSYFHYAKHVIINMYYTYKDI